MVDFDLCGAIFTGEGFYSLLVLNVLENLAHADKHDINEMKTSLQSKSRLPLEHFLREIRLEDFVTHVYCDPLSYITIRRTQTLYQDPS
jgi:hypothetical protein